MPNRARETLMDFQALPLSRKCEQNMGHILYKVIVSTDWSKPRNNICLYCKSSSIAPSNIAPSL